MRIASLVVVTRITSAILLVSSVASFTASSHALAESLWPQYEALSQCAETTQTSRGFRIELNSKKFKAGNESEVNEIGKVLSRFPQDRVLVQVYSGSEPLRDAEKVRDQLIERGVAPEQITLSGLIQDEHLGQLGTPTSMWLEIQPQA